MMNNITIIKMRYLLFTILAFATLSATAQKKWSLKDCITHALENNISVRQSQNALLTNDQDITAAKGNFLPSIGIGGSQRLNLGNVEVFDGNFVDLTFHSTNLGVNISQTVFNGF